MIFMAFSFSASVGVQGESLRHLPEPLQKDSENTLDDLAGSFTQEHR
jgi:hypothetical protein